MRRGAAVSLTRSSIRSKAGSRTTRGCGSLAGSRRRITWQREHRSSPGWLCSWIARQARCPQTGQADGSWTSPRPGSKGNGSVSVGSVTENSTSGSSVQSSAIPPRDSVSAKAFARRVFRRRPAPLSGTAGPGAAGDASRSGEVAAVADSWFRGRDSPESGSASGASSPRSAVGASSTERTGTGSVLVDGGSLPVSAGREASSADADRSSSLVASSTGIRSPTGPRSRLSEESIPSGAPFPVMGGSVSASAGGGHEAEGAGSAVTAGSGVSAKLDPIADAGSGSPGEENRSTLAATVSGGASAEAGESPGTEFAASRAGAGDGSTSAGNSTAAAGPVSGSALVSSAGLLGSGYEDASDFGGVMDRHWERTAPRPTPLPDPPRPRCDGGRPGIGSNSFAPEAHRGGWRLPSETRPIVSALHYDQVSFCALQYTSS